MKPSLRQRDPAAKYLTALFLIFAVALGILGTSYQQRRRGEIEQSVRDRLSAIADLKVGQLSRWRQERLGDAQWVRATGLFSGAVRACLAAPGDDAARDRVFEWMNAWVNTCHYSRLVLLDAGGRLRMVAPAGDAHWDASLDPAVRAAVKEDAVQIADLHREADARVRMDLVAPLHWRGDARATNVTVGLLVMEIDPADFLFTEIQAWPAPSRSGETLLLRREGDEVVYLNELRHATQTVLNLRVPLAQRDVPAVRAALGEEGVIEGIDYRGSPVLAAMRHVPDSPWGLVAKEDQNEIYAPLRRQAWATGLVLGLLLMSAFLGLMAVWRNREARFARHALAERTRSEEEHRALFQHLPAGVVVHAADTGIVFNNHQATLMLGLSEEQLRGKIAIDPAWCFYRENGSRIPPGQYPVNEVLATRGPIEDRVLGIDRPGTRDRVWVLVNAFPVFGTDGELRQVVVTFVNITDRKRAEDDRERLLRELGIRNEELESLLYAASHDLRGPLVSIEGFSHRLTRAGEELDAILRQPEVPAAIREQAAKILGERVAKALGFIHASADKLGTLISGMLRVSRQGHAAMHPRPLDMNRVVADAVAAQMFQVQQTGATVRIDPLPPCTGDADQIGQVISNLLDNALKYRDRGRPLRIRFSGRVEGGQAVYDVADTGRGIAAEHQRKIWVMFHRLYPEDGTPGEGLGLTLARRILERHGGRVWVDSTPGEGSCFHFSLPV